MSDEAWWSSSCRSAQQAALESCGQQAAAQYRVGGEGEGGWYVNVRIGKSDEFQVKVSDACFDEKWRLKRDSTCIVKEILL